MSYASDSPADARLSGSIAALRISLGAFLLVWAVMKFLVPSGTVGIFSHFYGLSIDEQISIVLGVVQATLAVTIILGLWRTWTLAAGFFVHLASQGSSWRQTLDPWGIWLGDKPQMLFWAGVPVLVAFAVVWLLRDVDKFALDTWRERRASQNVV